MVEDPRCFWGEESLINSRPKNRLSLRRKHFRKSDRFTICEVTCNTVPLSGVGWNAAKDGHFHCPEYMFL